MRSESLRTTLTDLGTLVGNDETKGLVEISSQDGASLGRTIGTPSILVETDTIIFGYVVAFTSTIKGSPTLNLGLQTPIATTVRQLPTGGSSTKIVEASDKEASTSSFVTVPIVPTAPGTTAFYQIPGDDTLILLGALFGGLSCLLILFSIPSYLYDVEGQIGKGK